MRTKVCTYFARKAAQIRKKLKGLVVPLNAIKAYRESKGIAPLIPNLGTTWR
jgi:hypothetical protein